MYILATVNAAWNIWNFRRPVIEDCLARGHKVTVLAPADSYVANLESIGCRFERLEMDAKGMNPITEMRFTRHLSRRFAQHSPDVILSYTPKNNIYGALAARRAGVPFIPNVSGLGTAFLSGNVLRLVVEGLYRQSFRDLDTVFFQNSDDRDLFVSRRLVSERQCRMLPGSGIDLDRFSPAPFPTEESEPIFLMIGRMLGDKGVFEFVEAARIVRATYPAARFQLLGAVDSENRTAIARSKIEEWQCAGAIEYLGTVEDVRSAIANARCVVLPSYREGAPRTLIEAAAMARPVIASNVPGCRAVVDHEVSGFLCEVRSAGSLAETCLRFLATSRSEQAEMGIAGRRKMEREFDQAKVVEAYREAIDRCTSAAEGDIL